MCKKRYYVKYESIVKTATYGFRKMKLFLKPLVIIMNSVKGKEVICLRENNVRIFSQNVICNCVNKYSGRFIRGELYNSYSKEPYRYDDIIEMLQIMEELYDTLQFPMSSTESRFFFNKKQNLKRKGMTRLMQDEMMLDKRGEKGTFIIQVQYRQNSSWQGKIVWVEKNETQHFRSALELIKLMDGALSEGVVSESNQSESELLSG